MKLLINLLLFFAWVQAWAELKPLGMDELDAKVSEMNLVESERVIHQFNFESPMTLSGDAQSAGVSASFCTNSKFMRREGSFMNCWKAQSKKLRSKLAYFQSFRKNKSRPLQFRFYLSHLGTLDKIKTAGFDENPAVEKQMRDLLKEMRFGKTKRKVSVPVVVNVTSVYASELR